MHFLLHLALVLLSSSGGFHPCAFLNFTLVCTYSEAVSWLLGNCSILFRLVQAKFLHLIRSEVAHSCCKAERKLSSRVLVVYYSVKLVDPGYVVVSWNVNPLLIWWGWGDNMSDQMCFYFLCSISFVCLRNVHDSKYVSFSTIKFLLFSLAKLKKDTYWGWNLTLFIDSFSVPSSTFLISFFFPSYNWHFLLNHSHSFEKIKICNMQCGIHSGPRLTLKQNYNVCIMYFNIHTNSKPIPKIFGNFNML